VHTLVQLQKDCNLQVAQAQLHACLAAQQEDSM